jgi:hypothetical protein
MAEAASAALAQAGEDVVAANVIAGSGGPVLLYMRPMPDAAGEVCTQQYLRVFFEPRVSISKPEDIGQAVAAHQTSVRLADLDHQYRRAPSADDCRNNLSASWTFAPDAGTFKRVEKVLDDLRATLAAGRPVTGYTCLTVNDGDQPCTDGLVQLKAFLALDTRIIFWLDQSTAQVSSTRGQKTVLQIHFRGDRVDTVRLVNNPLLFE